MKNEKENLSQTVVSEAENTQKEENNSLPFPSREQVGDWCKRDLKSAIYFLDYLYSRPEIFNMVVDAMYEDAKKGPKIS